MMKRTALLFPLLLSLTIALAQQAASITRIHPLNWWTGMKNQQLQLLVYGPKAGSMTYSIAYPGVQLVKKSTTGNDNYAFLDLVITPAARPGMVAITGKSGTTTVSRNYELKARTKTPKGSGVRAADLVYLVMPDRFANGDATNDRFTDMADTSADAGNPYLRHGGDLAGIVNHLDYLQELGVTTLWLTPVIENDEVLKLEGPGRMQAGYHGYHFTDHYAIDRRFGGAAAYLRLSETLHHRGMKLVQDAVYNHISDDHWLFKDPPAKDWFNNWPSYTGSSHKEQPMYDPYAAESDKKLLLDGWFTTFLPDLNQRNPLLANYLIQHAIWSTETFSLDGWRIDTYKYNDPAFMNRCNAALLAEYPNIHLFGESTASTPLGLSYFVQSNVAFPFKSNLPGTIDFPLNGAINDALKQPFGWDEGVSRLYQVLAQDIVYRQPMKLVTQLDNHDTDRFLSVIGDDIARYKMGVTWLLTLRGIPSWYYGTEILMKNFRNPSDAEVRRNFPGGFPGDADNKFTAAGRNGAENDAFDFVKKLANYRKQTPALHSGKMTQYVPQDGTFVYFRYDNQKTVMVVANTNDRPVSVKTDRFAERMAGFRRGTNIISGEAVADLSTLEMPAKTAWVLELGR